MSPQVAKEVGSRLGVVEEVEQKQRKDDFNYFMRVRVSLPISKPLRRGAFIASSDGERTWVKFKYERLSFFCHYCGLICHDLKHCVAHFATTKNTSDVKYEYGDFLKATGGRQPSPPRRNNNNSSSAGDKPVQSTETLKQPMEMTVMVVENFRLESPSFQDKDEIKDSGKPRNLGEIQITGSHVHPGVLPHFMQGNRYAIEDNANGK